jgi:DNA-binding transcriptional ArsR family regulator
MIDAGPAVARVAFLMGDPARALMLTSLMDGRFRTAGELARIANVAPSTASSHLAKLADAHLVETERHGRYRYYGIASPDVGTALEAMMAVAPATRTPARPFGPSDASLRFARVCYDHLAGEFAVAFADRCIASGLVDRDAGWSLTECGHRTFATLGIDLRDCPTKRPLLRPCMDWSERRHHIAGRLGAEVLSVFLARKWVRHRAGSRAVSVAFDWRNFLDRLGG